MIKFSEHNSVYSLSRWKRYQKTRSWHADEWCWRWRTTACEAKWEPAELSRRPSEFYENISADVWTGKRHRALLIVHCQVDYVLCLFKYCWLFAPRSLSFIQLASFLSAAVFSTFSVLLKFYGFIFATSIFTPIIISYLWLYIGSWCCQRDFFFYY